MSPWRRSTQEERRETLAAVALADSMLRDAQARLAEIEAREREHVRLDALDATVRARTVRAGPEPEEPTPDA
jgi:hypothetical protein